MHKSLVELQINSFYIALHHLPMDHQVPNLETLGGCMLAGDLQVKKMKKAPTYLIVGDSRVGKSSLFNYIRGFALKAVEKKNEEEDVQLVSQHADQTNTGNTFQSVTLVPNIRLSQYNMLDMAGFEDQNRSFVGVFGVSYMLEKVLSQVDEVKWIFVINQSFFSLPKIEDMLKPFLSFLSYFNLTTLIRQPNVLTQLVNSITIVASRSRDGKNFYLSKIKKMIDYYSAQSELTNVKKIILKLLQSIYENKRIDLFPKLNANQTLPRCNIIQQMNQANRKWTYYSFKRSLNVQSIIEMPFQKQFAMLKQTRPTDIKKYQEALKALKLKLTNCCLLLTSFVKQAISNWYSQEQIDYSLQYTTLDNLVSNHPYGSIEGLMADIDIQMPENNGNPCLRVDLVDNILKIQDVTDGIENLIYGVSKAYGKIEQIRSQTIKILQIFGSTFCNTTDQVNQFVLFICIFRRYLIEAEKINKIDNNSCAEIPNTLLDCLRKILPKLGVELFTEFISNFKERKDERKKISKLQKRYDTGKLDPKQSIKLTQRKLQNLLKSAIEKGKQKNYKSALRITIKGYRVLQQYKLNCANEEDNTEHMQLYEFRILQFFKLMAEFLNQEGKYIQAIKIYEQFDMVSLLLKTYDKFIEQPRDKMIQKFEVMQQYVKALQKYGKRDRLISLYQQMIDKFICYPKLRNRLKQKLSEELNEATNTDQYQSNLSNRASDWNQHDDKLNQIVSGILDKVLNEEQGQVIQEKEQDADGDQNQNQVNAELEQMEEQEENAFENRYNEISEDMIYSI